MISLIQVTHVEAAAITDHLLVPIIAVLIVPKVETSHTPLGRS